jgi:ABC-type Fe3+/spermidine/putrescine transport system ATPase subunit
VTDPNPTVLEAQNLRKKYPKSDQFALDDVSFSLARGERLSLLGPSGSGKSTLLNVLAGFLTPDSGSVVLEGRDATHVPTSRRDLGMVFQSFALFPHLSVSRNVEFGLRTKHVPAPERIARRDDALRMVGMLDYLHRRPKELSGGQQQRVAFARALASAPAVLLLDEPFASLDTRLRRELRDQLLQLHDRIPISSVLVTHDQEEALSFGDRVAVLRDGVLQQIADSETLYNKPANLFVARFLGTCSVIRGTISAVSSTNCTVTLDATGEKMSVPADRCSAELTQKIGTPVTILLRPEWLTIGAAGSGVAGRRISGILERRQFLGNQIEYLVDIAEGQTVSVTAPAPDPGQFQAGDNVVVELRSDAPALLYPEGDRDV